MLGAADAQIAFGQRSARRRRTAPGALDEPWLASAVRSRRMVSRDTSSSWAMPRPRRTRRAAPFPGACATPALFSRLPPRWSAAGVSFGRDLRRGQPQVHAGALPARPMAAYTTSPVIGRPMLRHICCGAVPDPDVGVVPEDVEDDQHGGHQQRTPDAGSPASAALAAVSRPDFLHARRVEHGRHARSWRTSPHRPTAA